MEVFYIKQELPINEDIRLKEVQLIDEQGQKLVSGRELHDVLEIGRDFTTWIKKMIDYGFQENIDYVLLTQTGEQKGRGGHNKTDYILTLEMAKHIAMVQRTEIGMKVRNYFIECEKVAQNPYANLSPELKAIFAIDNKQQELERQQKVIDQRLTNIEENANVEPGEYSLVAYQYSSQSPSNLLASITYTKITYNSITRHSYSPYTRGTLPAKSPYSANNSCTYFITTSTGIFFMQAKFPSPSIGQI